MQDRGWWLTMALSGAMVVVLGALAAHALKGQLEPRFEDAFITGVRYQAWHTLAAMALLAWRAQQRQTFQRQTLALWSLGTLLFSGSLYLLALASLSGTSLGAFGIVTPVGGAVLIVGWLRLAWGIWQQR